VSAYVLSTGIFRDDGGASDTIEPVPNSWSCAVTMPMRTAW
jgi:hypothetical protein